MARRARTHTQITAVGCGGCDWPLLGRGPVGPGRHQRKGEPWVLAVPSVGSGGAGVLRKGCLDQADTAAAPRGRSGAAAAAAAVAPCLAADTLRTQQHCGRSTPSRVEQVLPRHFPLRERNVAVAILRPHGRATQRFQRHGCAGTSYVLPCVHKLRWPLRRRVRAPRPRAPEFTRLRAPLMAPLLLQASGGKKAATQAAGSMQQQGYSLVSGF